MSVHTEIERINGEVASQTDLISQIKTTLTGKAAGGGSTKSTVSVTVINRTLCSIRYFDSNGSAQSFNNESRTIEALRGVVYAKTTYSYARTATGDVLSLAGQAGGDCIYIFMTDGGTLTIEPSSSAAD